MAGVSCGGCGPVMNANQSAPTFRAHMLVRARARARGFATVTVAATPARVCCEHSSGWVINATGAVTGMSSGRARR